LLQSDAPDGLGRHIGGTGITDGSQRRFKTHLMSALDLGCT
jgi:hypothetical protein